jgi:hypothetical protein
MLWVLFYLCFSVLLINSPGNKSHSYHCTKQCVRPPTSLADPLISERVITKIVAKITAGSSEINWNVADLQMPN